MYLFLIAESYCVCAMCLHETTDVTNIACMKSQKGNFCLNIKHSLTSSVLNQS